MGVRNLLQPGADLRSIFTEPNIERIPWSGCWVWMRGADYLGRGRFVFEGKSWVLSRLAYTIFVGPIPPKLLVCHTCDIHGCVNPNHMYAGTHRDNVLDAVSRGRHKSGNRRSKPKPPKKPFEVFKGESHGSSKLTNIEVMEIRRLEGVIPRDEIAAKFRISKTQVFRIINLQNWSHI